MFSRRRKWEKDSKCATYFDMVWRSNSHFSNFNWNDYVILNSFCIGTMKENEEKHNFRIMAYIELVLKCTDSEILYTVLFYIFMQTTLTLKIVNYWNFIAGFLSFKQRKTKILDEFSCFRVLKWVNVSCWNAKFGFVGKMNTLLTVLKRNKYVKLNGLLIEWENIRKKLIFLQKSYTRQVKIIK